MSGYLVLVCPRCGSVRYVKEGQKTAGCFRCGYQIRLDRSKTRVLVKVRNVEEAIEAVKRYKMKLDSRGAFQ